jgi:predicted aspartyl protease
VNRHFFAVLCAVLVLGVSLLGFDSGARGQGGAGTADAPGPADKLFEKGEFADAARLYAATVAGDPKNYHATFRLGEIALLGNRLDEAEKWLLKAIALKSDETAARVALAEAYCRRDEFLKAVPLLIAAGQDIKAKQLSTFKGQTPYQVEGPGEETALKFVATDPLPLVRVRVNGGKEVTFFLDTGASDVVLDTEFARELGVEEFGSVQGTFAGGEKAGVGLGRIASLTLGAWEVKNLPAATLPLRQFSKMLGAKQIDGALGTVLFYHFLTTLDYPKGQLVLRRRNEQNLKRFELAQGAGSVTVPFWMASDHFMVTFGRINDLKPMLFFVDTGTAGAGMKLGNFAIKEAGIKLLEDQAAVGLGGGGKVRSVPFVVDRLALGADEQRNVRGLYEGPFPWAQTFGFRLVGMVGHEFFRPSAVTFDFDGMRITIRKG